MSLNQSVKNSDFSEEKERMYYNILVIGYLSICLVHGLVYWYYGDINLAFGTFYISIPAVIFLVTSRFLTKLGLDILGVLITVFTTLSYQFIYGNTPTLFAYYLCIGVGIVSVTPRTIYKALLLSVSIILFNCFILSIREIETILPNTPQNVTISTLFYLMVALVWYVVERSNNALKKKVDLILKSRNEIQDQEIELAVKQKEMLNANNALERMSRKLDQKVELEEALTIQLAEKIEERQGLVNAIHSDLREPLRNIVSFSQLIKRKLDTVEVPQGAKEYLDFALDGGNRMSVMLSDLLKYTNDEEEEMAEVNLSDVIDELRVDLGESIARHYGKIEGVDLPIVMGYPTQLRQLFQNLIANALKFSKKGTPPIIIVSSSVNANGDLEVSVQDNGIGIDEQSIKTVFGLFNRAHSQEGFEGSGLGLAICKKIVTAHGAKISVSSVVGEGTKFSITGMTLANNNVEEPLNYLL